MIGEASQRSILRSQFTIYLPRIQKLAYFLARSDPPNRVLRRAEATDLSLPVPCALDEVAGETVD
jgi:hypothetical protein